MDLEKALKFKWRVEVFVPSSGKWIPRSDLVPFATAVRQMESLTALYPSVESHLVSDDDYIPTAVFTQAEIDAARSLTMNWRKPF